MKKRGLFALVLSIMLILSACGTPSSNTNPSDNTIPDNSTPAENTPTSRDSIADDFLKTITAETAEAQGLCGANLNWYYKDNVLVIKGTGAITEYDYYKDVPWNDYRDEINRVIIDDGCTALCSGLFGNYIYLSSVILPDSLTEMGEGVFRNCDELVSVYLGNGITSTGAYTFENCDKLETIELPKSLSVIGEGTFSYCMNLTDVEIPNSVTEIEYAAFYVCPSLESITIPEKVTTIGDCAFAECKNLVSVTIPESVTKINRRAFYSCVSLNTLTIPKSVTELGGGVFNGCSSLKNIDIKTPDYILEDNILFNKEKTVLVGALSSDMDTYTIPDGIVEMADFALDGLENLRTITFPVSLRKLGSFSVTNDKEGVQYSFIFLGNVPETKCMFGFGEYITNTFYPKYIKSTCTVYYSDSGFEEEIIKARDFDDTNITWVKQ